MASHGKSRHVKRLAAPVAHAIPRKAACFAAKPLPGAHKLKEGISLVALLRDVLRIVETAKEAQALLRRNVVFVDGRPAKDLRRSLGLMDVLAMPSAKKTWCIVSVKKKLLPQIVEENMEESTFKLCKIVGKRTLAKNKIQLILHDGRSCVISQKEDRFSLGDTVELSIPGQRIVRFFKLEPGARCYISHGKHSGKIATLKEFAERPGSMPTEAKLEREGQEMITLKKYLFAVPPEFQEPHAAEK